MQRAILVNWLVGWDLSTLSAQLVTRQKKRRKKHKEKLHNSIQHNKTDAIKASWDLSPLMTLGY